MQVPHHDLPIHCPRDYYVGVFGVELEAQHLEGRREDQDGVDRVQVLEVPEEDAGLVRLHRENGSFVEVQVLDKGLGDDPAGGLALDPGLELDARDLLALAVQVEQVLDLLDGVRDLRVLLVPLVLGQHVEVVLEDVDGLVGLQGCVFGELPCSMSGYTVSRNLSSSGLSSSTLR